MKEETGFYKLTSPHISEMCLCRPRKVRRGDTKIAKESDMCDRKVRQREVYGRKTFILRFRKIEFEIMRRKPEGF